MDRIWHWAWDRYGTRYSWAVAAVSYATLLPIYLLSAWIVAAYEESDRHVETFGATAAISLAAVVVSVQPGARSWRLMERWAAGDRLDRLEVLESTYSYPRAVTARAVGVYAIAGGALAVVVAAFGGASTSRLVQFGIVCTVVAAAVQLIAVHSFFEALMRPVRVAVVGDSGIGDGLPRLRPSFAAWSNMMIVATAFAFTFAGAGFGTVIDQAKDHPALLGLIAAGMALCFAVPITVGAAFAPSLRPIRDLAEGTDRVATGAYGQRLPVVQDDDLGALAASFNRMQAGLAERERLQAAFGSYVDPALATRLLDQGDDVFTGERRDVTVLFVDIRDFTAFAEASTAEDAVAHLNALFEIVVPAVLDAGGHVNKYLGDGAMAVFGAPNHLVGHADAAVAAALRVHRLVAERFGGALRIGTGINTGQVIAGTIGGGGKLEFTLIGDTVNVAARVEQLTKQTGDEILVTESTRAALSTPRPRSIKRGAFDLKGKSAAVTVHAVQVPRAR